MQKSLKSTSIDTLIEEVKQNGYTATGKKYGVTRSAISNKIRRSNIDTTNLTPYKNESTIPSVETLIEEVKEMGYKATGAKYGVSDNAVRKKLKKAKVDLKSLTPYKSGTRNGNYDEKNTICECGGTKKHTAKCCKKCYDKKQRKVERPSYKKFIEQMNEYGPTEVAKMYGVARSTLDKWHKYYLKEKNSK